MPNTDYTRDDNSQALINKDVNGFELYKQRRNRSKLQHSLEQRVADLESKVELLLQERELNRCAP